MAQPLKPLIQQDLSRGMNAVTNPYDIGNQQSISIVNALLDEHGSVRTRDGTALQTLSPDAAPNVRPIVKLFDFVLDATGGSSGQGGGGGGGGGAGSAPVVQITQPADGARVSPSVVTVTATAMPAAGLTIASVSLFLNGALSITFTSPPYSLAYNFTGATDGTPITFGASALDSAGNTGVAAPVTIVIVAQITPGGGP